MHFIYAISICITHISKYKIIILSYEVISLVIGINPGLLARWRGLTFMFNSNSQGLPAK